jgi:hypothetical protein
MPSSIGARWLDTHFAMRDPRQVQQVIDQPNFGLHVALDDPERAAYVFGQLLETRERRSGCQNWRERRPQLVAQHGDEGVFGVVGSASGFLGSREALSFCLRGVALSEVEQSDDEIAITGLAGARAEPHRDRLGTARRKPKLTALWLGLVARHQQVIAEPLAVVRMQRRREWAADQLDAARTKQSDRDQIEILDRTREIDADPGHRRVVEQLAVALPRGLELRLRLEQILVLRPQAVVLVL